MSELLRRRLGLAIRFLCDTDGTLLDALGIRHRQGRPPAWFMPPGHREQIDDRDIFLPTSFLVEVPEATNAPARIQWVHRPETYRVRATPDEVIAAIDTTKPFLDQP